MTANPSIRQAELEQQCLKSFQGYSPYYDIKPQVYARAGMNWHGVANSIGCNYCDFRLLWVRHPGETDGFLVEELLTEHRSRADLVHCQWAQLDAGGENSQAVKAAKEKWDSGSHISDTEDWSTDVSRLDLTYLERTRLEVDAIVSTLR